MKNVLTLKIPWISPGYPCHWIKIKHLPYSCDPSHFILWIYRCTCEAMLTIEMRIVQRSNYPTDYVNGPGLKFDLQTFQRSWRTQSAKQYFDIVLLTMKQMTWTHFTRNSRRHVFLQPNILGAIIIMIIIIKETRDVNNTNIYLAPILSAAAYAIDGHCRWSISWAWISACLYRTSGISTREMWARCARDVPLSFHIG